MSASREVHLGTKAASRALTESRDTVDRVTCLSIGTLFLCWPRVLRVCLTSYFYKIRG